MKYCAEQGCKTLIESGGYCDQHKRRRKRSRFKHNNKSLYNSAAWKRVSDYVYERDKGCCQRCGKFVFGKQAHVHHIVPVKKSPRLKLESSNLRLLCPTCHVIEEHESDKVRHYFK